MALNDAADALRSAANHEALLVSTTAGSERYRADVHEFFDLDPAQRRPIPAWAQRVTKSAASYNAVDRRRTDGSVPSSDTHREETIERPKSSTCSSAPTSIPAQDGRRRDRHDQPVPRARRGDDEGHGGRRRAHRLLPRPHLRNRRSQPRPAARRRAAPRAFVSCSSTADATRLTSATACHRCGRTTRSEHARRHVGHGRHQRHRDGTVGHDDHQGGLRRIRLGARRSAQEHGHRAGDLRRRRHDRLRLPHRHRGLRPRISRLARHGLHSDGSPTDCRTWQRS